VSLKTLKWGRMAIILAVVTLFCLMFAGAALASGEQWVMSPNEDITTQNVVKAMHTYNYTIEGKGLFADLNQFCDTDPLNPQHQLYIDFPFGNSVDKYDCIHNTYYDTFQVDANGSLTLKVDLTVDGSVYHLNVVAYNTTQPNGEPANIFEYAYDANGNPIARLALTIERQSIPIAGHVTDIRIEGIKVKNSPIPKADYCVRVRHQQDCFSPSNCINLNVVRTVGAVYLTSSQGCLISGSNYNVTGDVVDTEGRLWDQASWPVIIEYVTENQIPYPVPCSICPQTINIWDCLSLVDPTSLSVDQVASCVLPPGGAGVTIDETNAHSIEPVVAHVGVQYAGHFEQNITVPLVGGPYKLVARTLEVADTKEDNKIGYTLTTSSYNVPAEAIEDNTYKQDMNATHYLKGIFCGPEQYAHAWLFSDAQDISPESTNPKFIRLKLDNGVTQVECAPFRVSIDLLDKFGQLTNNQEPCGGPYNSLKVELNVFNEDGTINSGAFYDNADCLGAPINYVMIPGGAAHNCAWFKPAGGGIVKVQASAIIPLDPSDPGSGVNRIVSICPLEINCGQCMLEVTQLVTCKDSDLPRAGWPVKVSLHYDPTLEGTTLADPAHTTANIRVELLDPTTRQPISDASWDTIAKVTGNRLDFNAVGSNDSGSIFVHPNLSGYEDKSDIYVYVPSNFCGPLVVKVVDVDKHIKDEASINYVSPVELKRVLKPDSWQLISTPKELAGEGNMSSLVGNSYSDMFIYDKNLPGGPWKQITDADYKLLPQYGYLLKMKQNYSGNTLCPGNCGSEECIVANYVFARATNPEIPGRRNLSVGWNLVAPALEVDPSPAIPTTYNVQTICDPSDPCDCGELIAQGDALYRILGSACADCKVLVNWGGQGMDSTIYGSIIGGSMGLDISGEPNSMGNLANFSSATVNSGSLGGLAIDPQYVYGFNGDAYWLYITSTQTLAANNTLEIVKVTT